MYSNLSKQLYYRLILHSTMRRLIGGRHTLSASIRQGGLSVEIPLYQSVATGCLSIPLRTNLPALWKQFLRCNPSHSLSCSVMVTDG